MKSVNSLICVLILVFCQMTQASSVEDETQLEEGETQDAEIGHSKKKKVKQPIIKRLDNILARLEKIDASLGGVEVEEKPSSQENRVGKQFDVLFGGNFVEYQLLKNNVREYSSQTTLAYYIQPNIKLGVAYRKGSFSSDQKGSKEKFTADFIGYSVSSSYFFGNSIKANLAVHQNSIEFDGASSLDIQSIGLGLGNQWSWDSFVIAWDWVNYEVLISAKQGSIDLKDDLRSRLLLSSFSVGWAF